uniref:Uncharacterized protein n=1 Tax=Arundo donax TaxID=35708 RepID=A0A0A8YFJ0_ARUDO
MSDFFFWRMAVEPCTDENVEEDMDAHRWSEDARSTCCARTGRELEGARPRRYPRLPLLPPRRAPQLPRRRLALSLLSSRGGSCLH